MSISRKKQKTIDIEEFEFPFAEDLSYKAKSISLAQSIENEKAVQYFQEIQNLLTMDDIMVPVGFDCEWCPPWFRDEAEERVCTMQFYNPNVGAMVISTVGVKTLPKYMVDFFANPKILKVGVNIIGDGARIKRDFKITVCGLLNLGATSMEKIISKYCPRKFHIRKDTIENKVRLSDWSKFPLDNLQLKYASSDAVLSFVIFLFQQKLEWEDRQTFFINQNDNVIVKNIQSVEFDPSTDVELNETDQNELKQKKNLSDKSNMHFFIMHRNQSIVPPNLNAKEHPEGTKDCLKGFVIIVSGVLDSFSREGFTEYVKKHGGKVSKSITKSTSLLVNDHGVVGPSKYKQCQEKDIPIVGEDYVLDIVRKSNLQRVDDSNIDSNNGNRSNVEP